LQSLFVRTSSLHTVTNYILVVVAVAVAVAEVVVVEVEVEVYHHHSDRQHHGSDEHIFTVVVMMVYL